MCTRVPCCTLTTLPPAGDAIVLTSELTFTIIFTVEMAAKFVAFGVVGKGSYFGDPWNWVDALVVAIGWVPYTTSVGNISSLRVLRLIKACADLPGLRVTVGTLINAIPNTFAVLAFGLLYMLLWALIGLQMWAGVMAGTCSYASPITNETVLLPEARCALPCSEISGELCSSTYGNVCPSLIADTFETESFCIRGPNPDSGITSFDNVGSALLTSFIAIVAEGWIDTMYQLWEAWGIKPLVSIIFTFHRFFGVWAIFQVRLWRVKRHRAGLSYSIAWGCPGHCRRRHHGVQPRVGPKQSAQGRQGYDCRQPPRLARRHCCRRIDWRPSFEPRRERRGCGPPELPQPRLSSPSRRPPEQLCCCRGSPPRRPPRAP